jgi:hypothetical protein
VDAANDAETLRALLLRRVAESEDADQEPIPEAFASRRRSRPPNSEAR